VLPYAKFNLTQTGFNGVLFPTTYSQNSITGDVLVSEEYSVMLLLLNSLQLS